MTRGSAIEQDGSRLMGGTSALERWVLRRSVYTVVARQGELCACARLPGSDVRAAGAAGAAELEVKTAKKGVHSFVYLSQP
jgi:hypothetical protein